jgi:DNA polymerase III delta prime subunit
MLLHDRTRQSVDLFLKKPASVLALVGEKGTGKQFLAENIASKLLGTKSAHNHPYIHIIDAESVESAIGAVRELQKKLTLRVPGSQFVKRVVVISHFDQFGHEAQNAMLKTLEEPPIGTVFLLTIDFPERVLSTIYSRVHQLRVLPVPLKVVNGIYKSEDVSKAYQISGGAAGLFTSLLREDHSSKMVIAISDAKKLLSAPKHVRISAVENIIKNKELTSEELLDGLLRILEASQKQTFSQNRPDQQKLTMRRVKLTLDAIKDLQEGVSQKLVLTRLFFEL